MDDRYHLDILSLDPVQDPIRVFKYLPDTRIPVLRHLRSKHRVPV
jgi:hypothetical protein